MQYAPTLLSKVINRYSINFFSQKEGFLNLLSNLKIYKEKIKKEE